MNSTNTLCEPHNCQNALNVSRVQRLWTFVSLSAETYQNWQQHSHLYMVVRMTMGGEQDFVLANFYPVSHYGKNFITSFLSLETLWSPVQSYKTLFFVNLLMTTTIVFKKTCFINKNILEIKNKFIRSNQTNI